jgi:hypothetical protein
MSILFIVSQYLNHTNLKSFTDRHRSVLVMSIILLICKTLNVHIPLMVSQYITVLYLTPLCVVLHTCLLYQYLLHVVLYKSDVKFSQS